MNTIESNLNIVKKKHDKRPTIGKALYSSASSHQPHSLKAYLSANYLNGYFAKTDNVWLKASELIDKTEIEVLGE